MSLGHTGLNWKHLEAGIVLTSRPCCRAGWLGWRWDLSLCSPQCCYCRCTWQGKSLLLCCTAAGWKTPDDLKRKEWKKGEKLHERQNRRKIWWEERDMQLLQVCVCGWAQVDLAGFNESSLTLSRITGGRLFARGFVWWHGATLALKWSSNSSAVMSSTLCAFWSELQMNTHTDWDILTLRERNEALYSWLYCKAVHSWESMAKKLGYLLKEHYGILREERHE